MKNDVTLGVTKWAGDQPADEEHPAQAEIHQHWVRVGDVVLTAKDHGLIDVQYGVDEAGGISGVTIRLFPSSFQTVAAEELEDEAAYDARSRHERAAVDADA